MVKRQIPNLLTLSNLFCGVLSVLMALSDRMIWAAFFILLGIFFDFFDGYFARLLKVGGDFGKELDSLADMVTSGVAPGFIMFQLLTHASQSHWFSQLSCEKGNWQSFQDTNYYLLPFIGLIIPLASAIRLAKFNIDERQSDSFLGLPTPAMSLFVASLSLILFYAQDSFFVGWIENTYFLVSVTLIFSVLMNVELPMFSLKFKHYKWRENETKYFFLMVCLGLIATLKIVSIPLIIGVYILFSIFDNQIDKQKNSN